MRFRTKTPKAGSRKYCSYRQIAQVLNLSENQVQHICRYRHQQSAVTRCRRRLHKLSPSHVRYLIDRETLRSWAGYTLAERAALFERRFHSKRLAVTTLRRIYLQNGVKRKKVRQEKVMPQRAWENFDENRRELIQKLALALEQGRKIIYLDEICFTKRSFLGVGWSRTKENLHVDQVQIYQGYRATIAAVSEERGVEHISTYNQAVVTSDFKDYLRVLRRGNRGGLALFMDQLAVHRAGEVKVLCAELDITILFNVSYSPEFNPIESVFSQVKRTYARVRL